MTNDGHQVIRPMGNAGHKDFGQQLRWWRRRRGISQLELAGAAGTSQRHLSFLESGRAAPSQQIVLNLAAALNISLRQQNTFLASAGYAAQWREGKLASLSWREWMMRSITSSSSKSHIPLSSSTGIGT